jgi:hypothetical protein
MRCGEAFHRGTALTAHHQESIACERSNLSECFTYMNETREKEIMKSYGITWSEMYAILFPGCVVPGCVVHESGKSSSVHTGPNTANLTRLGRL